VEKIDRLLTDAIINLEEKKRHSSDYNLKLEEDKEIKRRLKSYDHQVYLRHLCHEPIYDGGGWTGLRWPFITPFN
jgi:hypothetical protein